MKTMLLLKEVYAEAFRNIGNYIVKNFFKSFAIFTLVIFAIALYAFFFRLATGFAFD